MNDDFDTRMDDRLRSLGADWRARHHAGTDRVDPALFVDRHARRPLVPALAALTGLLALVVIAVVIVISLPPANPDVANSSPSPSSRPSSVRPDRWTRPRPRSLTASRGASTVAPAARDQPGLRRDQLDKLGVRGPGASSVGQRADNEHLLLSSSNGEAWDVLARFSEEHDPRAPVRIFEDPEVGFVAVVGLFHSGPGAGLWLSSDGLSWDLVGDDPVFDVPGCEPKSGIALSNIFRAHDVLVVQGQVYCGSLIYTRTWTSLDGRTWQQAEQVLVEPVVAAHGKFVGGTQTPRHDAAIEVSDDGLHWTQVMQTNMELSIGAVSSGFVAVGRREDGRPLVLTSADGAIWDTHADALPAQVNGLLGYDGSRAAFVDPADFRGLWISSTDGTQWQRFTIPVEHSQTPDRVAILGDRVVVTSYDYTVVWVADIPDGTTPSPTPVPTPTATPTTTATPVSNTIDLPADAIRTVTPAGTRPFDGFAQFGPLAASVTDTGLSLFDLEHETTTELFRTRRNEFIVALDMNGDNVVWVVGKYDVNSHRVPCDVSGGLDWRVVVYTISTGAQHEIASGRNVKEIGCAAWAPTAAVDGDFVAYSAESADPAKWQITMRSIASGEVTRTIDAGRVVADLDVARGDVAFTTGVPSDPSNPYVELGQLRLMLSTQAEPEPRVVARGEWGVSFADGRMVWGSDSSDTSPAQCWTATIDDLTPLQIAVDAGRGCSPQTSGDLVSFVTWTDADTTGNIWDARTGLTRQLTPGLWLDGIYTSGGWLVWTGDTLGPVDVWTVQGLPLSDVGIGE